MQSLLATLTVDPHSASASAHQPQAFDVMMFVSFLGMTITMTCWFVRHVPKTNRPLALPLFAFIGLMMVVVATSSTRSGMAEIILVTLAFGEAARVRQYFRQRATDRRRAHETRWSVDPSRHERLFGESREIKPARRTRYGPGTRPEPDGGDDDGSCAPAA